MRRGWLGLVLEQGLGAGVEFGPGLLACMDNGHQPVRCGILEETCDVNTAQWFLEDCISFYYHGHSNCRL